MRLAVKKLQVEDAAKLQTLVVENLDGIEPGLAALDARLLLGHSTIDVVAMDAAERSSSLLSASRPTRR